jgi:CHAT domain-containing protein
LTQSAIEAGRGARKLRELLWLPLELHLAGIRTVINSPDTTLGTLPFAALPGKTEGSYLIEEYKFVSLPLAGMLRSLLDEDAERLQPERGLLILGDVDYASDQPTASRDQQSLLALANETGRLRRTRGDQYGSWESLSGFRTELDKVSDLYRQRFGSHSSITTLSGANATEDVILREAASCDTLHLITHGFFADPSLQSIARAEVGQDDAPSAALGADPFFNTWLPSLLSGLVMAGANTPPTDPEDLNDGILSATEIETTSLQGVDLIVLSACETGLGAVAGGEGLTGLQRAFHVAGARSVIASLWKVDDRATQILMERFYKNLWQEKMSKIDALREAQLWMLRHPKELEEMGVTGAATRGLGSTSKEVDPTREVNGTVERTDPFFWAAFQLSGDWR